ncbi:hypothetical protein [Nonomuraea recticatena]|uniref:Uncharacterized protein n=1 Tax=Nonomuraea recticatena TaxID=46178 RepID=A0ABP6DV68_9ACTN
MTFSNFFCQGQVGAGAPAEVILGRVEARTTNPYGKRPEERAAILDDLREVEPLLRATAPAEIDTRIPVDAVADRLEKLTGNPVAPGHPHKASS